MTVLSLGASVPDQGAFRLSNLRRAIVSTDRLAALALFLLVQACALMICPQQLGAQPPSEAGVCVDKGGCTTSQPSADASGGIVGALGRAIFSSLRGPSAEERASRAHAEAVALNEKGLQEAKQKNWAAAAEYFRRAMLLKPGDSVIAQNLATVRLIVEREEQARQTEALEQARLLAAERRLRLEAERAIAAAKSVAADVARLSSDLKPQTGSGLTITSSGMPSVGATGLTVMRGDPGTTAGDQLVSAAASGAAARDAAANSTSSASLETDMERAKAIAAEPFSVAGHKSGSLPLFSPSADGVQRATNGLKTDLSFQRLLERGRELDSEQKALNTALLKLSQQRAAGAGDRGEVESEIARIKQALSTSASNSACVKHNVDLRVTSYLVSFPEGAAVDRPAARAPQPKQSLCQLR